jgi:hypothetical protein
MTNQWSHLICQIEKREKRERLRLREMSKREAKETGVEDDVKGKKVKVSAKEEKDGEERGGITIVFEHCTS